jgi:hypothetical protein
VRKEFRKGGAAILEESRNGVDFDPAGLPSLEGPALRLRDVEGIIPLNSKANSRNQ